jgi:hypothetical protein
MMTKASLVWASNANAPTMRCVARDESVIPTGSEDEHGTQVLSRTEPARSLRSCPHR